MQSHRSVIGIVRTYFQAWRRSKHWSNETAFQFVVDAHECMNGPAITGISFAPPTQDTFTRQRVNAERICRWLDDESKSNNLLPVNFLPSLLAALPMECRAELIEEVLRPLGLGVRLLAEPAESQKQLNIVTLLRAMMHESSDAQSAMVALLDGSTQEELISAATELRQARDTFERALVAIEPQIATSALRVVK